MDACPPTPTNDMREDWGIKRTHECNISCMIHSFLPNSNQQERLQEYHLKSQVVIEQKTITTKSEVYLIPPILLESQQTLLCLAEVKDTLYLMPLSKQGLNVLELQKDLSIAIPTQVSLTLFGHTNTTGSTLWKKKEKSLKIPK